MASKKAKNAERFTSEDLHRALFDEPPEPRTVEEMDEAIRRAVKLRAAKFKKQSIQQMIREAT